MGKAPTTRSLTAADLLVSSSPLNANFVKWCKGRNTPPTKRQARKYLQANPQLRSVDVEVKVAA